SVINGGVDLGSPSYAAPEQARSQEDPRTDVYSLGATLYHMMIGKIPLGDFQSARPDIEIPAQAEAVVMRCLEKEPERRFQSIAGLLEEMQRVALAVDGWAIPLLDLATPPPMRRVEIPAAPLGRPTVGERALTVGASVLPPEALGETSSPPPPVEARDSLEKPGMHAPPELGRGIPSPGALLWGVPIRALWEKWRWVLTGGAAAFLLVILTISAVARLTSRKPSAAPAAMPRRVASIQPAIAPPPPTPPSEATIAPTTPSPKSVRFVVASEPPGALVFA